MKKKVLLCTLLAAALLAGCTACGSAGGGKLETEASAPESTAPWTKPWAEPDMELERETETEPEDRDEARQDAAGVLKKMDFGTETEESFVYAPDTISGRIRSVCFSDSGYVFLTDEGDICLYKPAGLGYECIKLAENTGISSLGDAYLERSSTGDKYRLTVIDGNTVMYKVISYDGEEAAVCMSDDGRVLDITATLLEGREIRTSRIEHGGDIYLADAEGRYYAGFQSYYNEGAEASAWRKTFLDSEGVYWNPEAAGFMTQIFPEVSIAQFSGEYFLTSDGALYVRRAGSSHADREPLEVGRGICFSRLFLQEDNKNYIGYTAALTEDDGIYLISCDRDEPMAHITGLPDGGILEVHAHWQFQHTLLVKTGSGYYYADFDDDGQFREVEVLNAVYDSVVQIFDDVVLLDDGCMYRIEGL